MSEQDLLQSRAARLPNLSGAATQSFTHNAGSIAKKDLLQLEAQAASDQYNLVAAEKPIPSECSYIKSNDDIKK